MLIIPRRAGESFFVGDDVEVTVLSMEGGEARIGITAPRDSHPIIRKEHKHPNHTTPVIAKSSGVTQNSLLTGTILSLKEQGFGFIYSPSIVDQRGQALDVFLHASNVTGGFDNIDEGDEVTFTIEYTRKGPVARNIALAAKKKEPCV